MRDWRGILRTEDIKLMAFNRILPTAPGINERLSVDDLKGISADFAAICRRVSEHPILVLPSIFPIRLETAEWQTSGGKNVHCSLQYRGVKWPAEIRVS